MAGTIAEFVLVYFLEEDPLQLPSGHVTCDAFFPATEALVCSVFLTTPTIVASFELPVAGTVLAIAIMAESFTLPLRPPPEQNERPDTLPVEIAQINNQWGSFREVNEEILLAKIAEEEKRHGAQQDEDMDEGEQEVGEIDPTERREQLYKRRHEITQFAMLVTPTLKGALERSAANECLNSKSHQETMLALDFISLLLSKHAPRQAETSMSPMLKQLAPLGSLDSDLVNPPPRPESSIKDISTVSRGWRIQNFNSASSKLLSAATRLNDEIESEIRYWGEVLAIKDKGWKVCRHPREKQALAVQYGFMEGMMILVLRRHRENAPTLTTV